METILFPCRSSQHSDAQYQGLLQYQDQDSRYQKTGKTILGIKQRYRFIRDRVYRDLVHLIRRRRIIMHPKFLTHIQRYLCRRQKESLIKQ